MLDTIKKLIVGSGFNDVKIERSKTKMYVRLIINKNMGVIVYDTAIWSYNNNLLIKKDIEIINEIMEMLKSAIIIDI